MKAEKTFAIFSVVLVQCLSIFHSTESTDVRSLEEFGRSHGYPTQNHIVTTPDGYILTLHRLFSPKMDLSASPDPFILQHGLVSNSAQWIILEPRQNLACILADNGFDVWMPNIRGNMYSRKHKRLSPNNAEFWNFSWHEHGTIDMPAIIDYILNTTKHKQVWYAGHSMGTTMFFVMASMRPEYNKKIRHMFALAPVAYMSHIKFEMAKLAPHIRTIEPIATTALNGHLGTDFLLMQLAKHGVCSTLKKPCADAANSLFGPNPRSNATVMLQVLRTFYPDYASVRQLVHYAQLMNNDFTFRMYDYFEHNMAKYNVSEPPRYPVEKITAPVTFIYSENDYLAETIDVETFSENLPNVCKMYKIPDPKFNHMDFILSTYADEVVYHPMLKMVQEHRMSEQTHNCHKKNVLT